MIGSIRGTLIDKSENQVVIETHGIGYVVHTITEPAADAGGTVHVWTYLAVREQSLDLYGFDDQYTRSIFTALLTIPKIGPKSAQQILQKSSIELLVSCVETSDAKRLAKLSGLGPKTAEKVVLSLADALPAGATPTTTSSHSGATQDVVDALVALGYGEREAYDTVTHLTEAEPEHMHDVPTAITRALQHIRS